MALPDPSPAPGTDIGADPGGLRIAVPPEILQRCWFLAGPTAAGKSAVSLELAIALRAEIVSMDSMALYRGMDIGTAKPDAAARSQTPHHLLDVIDPHEEYSLAQYVQAATQVCREILNRGRTPLFVGGTGLYLRSMLRGLFQGPPADWNRRQRWSEQAEREGPHRLHQQLQAVDPATASRLHPNDIRRVSRALEVFELTGQPLSSWQQEHPLPPHSRPPVFWLDPERLWLHSRIETRVQQMLRDGWVDEVRNLLQGRPLSRTARQAVGYRELIDHLEGRLTYSHALRQMIDRTRQFAKRQYTWFRNLEECTAVSITPDETTAHLVSRLLQAQRGSN